MLFNDYQLIMYIKTTKDVFQNNKIRIAGAEPKPGTHVCGALKKPREEKQIF